MKLKFEAVQIIRELQEIEASAIFLMALGQEMPDSVSKVDLTKIIHFLCKKLSWIQEESGSEEISRAEKGLAKNSLGGDDCEFKPIDVPKEQFFNEFEKEYFITTNSEAEVGEENTLDQVHDPLQAPIKDSVEQDQRNISKSFSCSQCGKKFKQKTHLKTHEQIHTGKKPFTCSKCLLSNHLKQHERMHTGDKPYSCSICAKNFRQLAHLKRHERIHTGDKPFTCSDCDFKSNSKDNLDAYKRIHKGDKPFNCSHCSKKFTSKPHLKRHKSDHCPFKNFCRKNCKNDCQLIK